MNALLDINVVLDVFLNRQEFLPDSAAVLLANQEKRLVGHLSAATLPTVYYIVRRNADRERARAVVIECLNSFSIVAVGRSTAELACTFDGRDFEDNLQMAAAVEGRLDAIITRDPAGYPNNPLPVFLPGQAVAELSKRGNPMADTRRLIEVAFPLKQGVVGQRAWEELAAWTYRDAACLAR